jgi:hypothetical protein
MSTDTHGLWVSLDTIKDYNAIQGWLDDYCQAKGKEGWHNYGPADLRLYESDPVKIMLMGAESLGYEKCLKVPSDAYIEWIRKREWTPRNGAVFVSTIRDYISRLTQGSATPEFDKAGFTDRYQNVDLLVKEMSGTIYMNARITSNGTGTNREDKAQIACDLLEFAEYRRRFLEIMKPEIVICAGASATDSLFGENGPFPRSALQKGNVFEIGNILFVITRHLSRFGGYKAMHEIGLQCAKMYVEKGRGVRP